MMAVKAGRVSLVPAILVFAASFHCHIIFLPFVHAQSACELSLEVYEFPDDCTSGSSLKDSGSVIADGACREASSSSWLPGIYSAVCDSLEAVKFIDSGCSSLSTCEESSNQACDVGDNSLNSWMYARINNPIYPTDGTCFVASYTNSLGDTLEATFKFTGVCNADCGGSAPADPTDPPASLPTQYPVPPPTRSPITSAPVEPPLTPAPVEPPPVDEPPVQPPVEFPGNMITQSPVELPTGDPATSTPTRGPAEGDFVPSPVSGQGTALPTTTPILDDNDETKSTIFAALRFEPFDALLSEDNLNKWGQLTSDFFQRDTMVSKAVITKMSQTLIPRVSERLLQQGRGLQQAQQALEISFMLESTHNLVTTLDILFIGTFDTQTERAQYLLILQGQLDEFDTVESVQTEIVSESPSDGNGDSSNKAGLLAGVVVAVVATVLLSGLFVWRRRKGSRRSGHLESPGTQLHSKFPKEVTSSSSDPNSGPQQQWTNEITLDLHAADDVSTLEGGTLPDNATVGRLYDDHTATVDLNNYHHAAYGQHGVPEEGTADEGTSLSKVSQIGSFASVSRRMELSDDTSFEAQFSPNGMAPLEEVIGSRVKPFVVEASPGVKLGMVIESETTVGLPYVRAVRSDSEFRNRVQEGDLVISVNRHDVTNMTAMEVSELISAKQFEHRTLMFGRPEKKLHLPF